MDKRLQASLKYQSLFSEYLPSSFSLDPMNDCDIFAVPYQDKSDNISPYSFTMSNFSANRKRRTIHLPEVTCYLKLIEYMIKNEIIDEMCELSSENQHSFSQIIQSKNGEPTFIEHERDYGLSLPTEAELHRELDDDPSTYVYNIATKLNMGYGAKGVLRIDIANCYKSIYTHYLVSIKLGLSESKKQHRLFRADRSKASCDYKKYSGFDRHIRGLNSNESSGILPGPRVSNYIAEAYLSRIDKDIEDELTSRSINPVRFVRYVDDYEFFIYDERAIQTIISAVELVLNRYRLTVNDYKTEFQAFPYYVIQNFRRLYERYTVNGRDMSPEDMIELFTTFFTMEKDGSKGAIRYLVKTLEDHIVFQSSELYTTFLFNILVNDDRSLVKVCQLMIRDIDKLDITAGHYLIIQEMLMQNLKSNKDLEAIWLLYLLKKLGHPELDSALIENIACSANDLAKIVLLEEYGLSDGQTQELIDSAESWILLYQLFLRDKICASEFREKSFIHKNLSFYKQLKSKGFSFYRVTTAP